jgi:hypothetical protein
MKWKDRENKYFFLVKLKKNKRKWSKGGRTLRALRCSSIRGSTNEPCAPAFVEGSVDCHYFTF